MSTVYAAYLFGASVAYLVVHFGISFLGVTRFMVASVALIVLAAWLTRSSNKSWLTLELVFLSAIVCWLTSSGAWSAFSFGWAR